MRYVFQALNLDFPTLFRRSPPHQQRLLHSAISRFIETINCPLIITSRDRRSQRQRPY